MCCTMSGLFLSPQRGSIFLLVLTPSPPSSLCPILRPYHTFAVSSILQAEHQVRAV